MTNPFYDSLDDSFRNHRVVARSGDGTIYTGYVDRLDYKFRHAVLHAAHRGTPTDPGKHVGRALVSNADWIELAPNDSSRARSERIERINLADLTSSPYACRTFDAEDNQRYINSVSEKGSVGSFPVVRSNREADENPSRPTWEIVEGHKRAWVGQEAGLDTHPFEVIECTDWEAARIFADDHLPGENEVKRFDETDEHYCPSETSSQARKSADPRTFIISSKYGDQEIRDAINRLYDRWSENATELPGVEFNADRLDMSFDNDADSGFETMKQRLNGLVE
jgi:hypothetical protein